jgi:hypothetical protein
MDRDVTVNSIVYTYRGDDKGISTRRNVALGIDKPRDMLVGTLVDKDGTRRTKLEFTQTDVDSDGKYYTTRVLVQAIVPKSTTSAQLNAVLDQVQAALASSSPDFTTLTLVNGEI